METMKPVRVLMNYFNTNNDPPGYVKVKSTDFAKEIGMLSAEEKAELVALAAADMGVAVES